VNRVVDAAEDLTPDWLSEALRAGGHDLTVSSVTSVRIGSGQIGASYRLGLAYEGAPGPATLVAKLAGGDAAARARVADGYAKEVGFYTHLARTVDVRTPRCWYGAIASDHTSFTLLLDDVVGASPGVQAEGCTVAQAEGAVRNLAGLHAPRWNDPTLGDHDFLGAAGPGMASLLGDLVIDATEPFIERYHDRFTADDKQTLRDAARAIGVWHLARPDPFAIIHGDYRLDNLMFPEGGNDVTALDWQTVTIAPPARDLAYFLGTSLVRELRRAHEEALVALYHGELLARGVAGYDAATCWDDYRLGHLQGPMITVLGCTYATAVATERSDAMFVAMATRSCAAIRDLGSLDLL
jgi:hypothetical protein